MDDVPVLGEESPRRSPDGPSWWLRFLPAVAVAVVLASFWAIGRRPPPAPEAAPLPPVPTTPATLPEPVHLARLVDETLEWTSATGLEEMIAVDAVLDGPSPDTLLVGRDTQGVTVYRSGDGVTWESVITLAADGGEPMTPEGVAFGGPGEVVAATVDDVFYVAVSAFAGGGDDPWLWHSDDGELWTGSELPRVDDSWGPTQVDNILSFQGGLLVTGYSYSAPDPASLVADLSPDLVVLVESRQALPEIEDGERLTVRISPGLVVYSRPLNVDEVEAVRTGATEGAVGWTGTGPDSLTAAPRSDTVSVRAARSDVLVGWTGNGVVLAADGESWQTPIPGISPGWDVRIWNGQLVATGDSSQSIIRWDPDTENLTTLTSPEIMGGRSIRMFATGGAGIVAIAGGRYTVPESESAVLADLGDVEWRLTSSMNLILRRDDGEGASMPVYDAEASFENGSLELSLDGEHLEVPVDVWLDAVGGFVSAAFEDVYLVHSTDGTAWSRQSWQAIAGRGTVSPVVFSADDFVLAVDQGTGSGVVGAWVGRPVP